MKALVSRSCFDQEENERDGAEKVSEVLTGTDVNINNILTAELLVYNLKGVDIAYARANTGIFLKEPHHKLTFVSQFLLPVFDTIVSNTWKASYLVMLSERNRSVS